MASGTASIHVGCPQYPSSNTYYYVLSTNWWENSYSVENNTSNITINASLWGHLVYYSGSAYDYWTIYWVDDYDHTTPLLVNQIAQTNLRGSGEGNTVWISGNINVRHKPDGSLHGYCYVVYTKATTNSYAPYGTTLNSSADYLTTIPRSSQPTLNVNKAILDATQITILTNRAANIFTHTITYSIGSKSGLIGNNVTDSIVWTPSLDLATEIANSGIGVCTINCITYNNNTTIGVKTVNIDLEVPANILPKINSVTVEEADPVMIDKNWGVYVKNKSKLKVSISAEGILNSTIKAYQTTVANVYTNNNQEFITPSLTQSGNQIVSVIAKDTRDRDAQYDVEYVCVDYNNPTIRKAEIARCLEDGTEDDNGTYIKYTLDASISPVENHNLKEFKIGYRIKDTFSYETILLDNTNYDYNKSDQIFTIEGGFDADTAYDIIFIATDSFSTSQYELDLPTGFDLFNFNMSGKSMAIGKVSEANIDDELLEIALDTNFLGQILQNGSPLPSILNENSTSTKDTYSANYINTILNKKGDTYKIVFSRTDYWFGSWEQRRLDVVSYTESNGNSLTSIYTGQITVQESGWYYVGGRVSLIANQGDISMTIFGWKDGNAFSLCGDYHGNPISMWNSVNAHSPVYLEAGTNIYLVIACGAAGTYTVLDNSELHAIRLK